MFQIPSFDAIKRTILDELLNLTGLSVTSDSDAAVRAAGTAAVVESIYDHQAYLARQNFVATCDEPYLYLHAERLNTPRIGGNKATGDVLVTAYATLTLPAGVELTDGRGQYFFTTSDTLLAPGAPVSVPIIAEQIGAAYNQLGTLSLVTALEGVDPVAQIDNLSGGMSEESLERWRARVLARQQLGEPLARIEDFREAVLSVPGVADCYIYPARRGAGSVDAAITAMGADGATLPSDSLLSAATAALVSAAVFFESVRAFRPTLIVQDVSAVVSGSSIDTTAVRQTIERYMTALTPAEPYRESVLASLITDITGVLDVVLTPNANITPTVDMTGVGWIRPGNISVTLS